ncbi:MAG: hypothetical protein GVY13_17605 [Alphaproteobacteria bacterium]|jgi:hypothetical protein|nr:hypothetical protein [Alphaproteobacteria bacterium]
MTAGSKTHATRGRSVRRAGITSGTTDTESGNEAPGVDRDLYALKSLYERGLIPKEVYETRRAELLGDSAGPDTGPDTGPDEGAATS